jgi:response regulator RpfG family c-di-GMP phosphodiesterase
MDVLQRPGATFRSREQNVTTPALPASPLPRPARNFLEQLVHAQLLDSTAINPFLQQYLDRLPAFLDLDLLGDAMVHSGLLTPYQLNRIKAGTTHGLVLGNYRVRDRLGGGSVGVVFLGEHILLRRKVAIKVVPVDDNFPAAVLERFHSEMRVLAEMQHPHVVLAYDAGRLLAPSPNMPALHFLVMELLPGGDLEQYIDRLGPATVPRACEWLRQAASGLQEAHDRHLIHRDLKPSNMLLTANEQVKLVDFGLARQFTSNRTDPRALLGSLDFMAPEQSIDPSSVGTAADIYGLGATFFWLLTGHPPYASDASVAKALYTLQFTKPRRVRDLMPDVPAELDELVDRMLARDAAARPPSPLAIMPVLAKFTTPSAPLWDIDPLTDSTEFSFEELQPIAAPDTTWRVLIAGAEAEDRESVRHVLEEVGCECGEATIATTALRSLRTEPYAVAVIELSSDRTNAFELCQSLRADPPRPHLKLILHGEAELDAFAETMLQGADDFLPHPLDLTTLAAKVQHSLRLKDAQDRADRYAQHLLRINRQLHSSLAARAGDVRKTQDAMLFAMAKLAESRDGETAGHLRRLQQYVVCLGRFLQDDAAWKPIVDAPFLAQLERCTPLHDIGKLVLPDQILLKPAALTPDERRVMQQHTIVGCAILDAIGREYGESLDFLSTARGIVRHHHERFDGSGYPDKLAGDAIPAAARLVALADVYDALRRKRPHKPALSHARASDTILREMNSAFDPAVLRAFAACHERFQRIFLAVVS